MAPKSEKENRKELLRALRDKEKENFLRSLPMEKQMFLDLFDHLDRSLADDCRHDMTLTRDFLIEKGISSPDTIIDWLNEKGAFCDCEVLFNVEEQFE